MSTEEKCTTCGQGFSHAMHTIPAVTSSAHKFTSATGYDLKPCPFCGAAVAMRDTEDNANYIECTKCGASTNLQYSVKEDARPDLIEWNKRTLAGPQNGQGCERIELLEKAAAFLEMMYDKWENGDPSFSESGDSLGNAFQLGSYEDQIIDVLNKLFPRLPAPPT